MGFVIAQFPMKVGTVAAACVAHKTDTGTGHHSVTFPDVDFFKVGIDSTERVRVAENDVISVTHAFTVGYTVGAGEIIYTFYYSAERMSGYIINLRLVLYDINSERPSAPALFI